MSEGIQSSVEVLLKDVSNGTAVIEIKCNANELLFGTNEAMMAILERMKTIIDVELLEQMI